MILSEISIRRPVSAIVLSVLMLLLGIISFLRLPVRELPNVEMPSVSISISYTGASPEVMENRVTKVIEDELSGISGIKKIVSTSRSGKAWISLEFKKNKDMLEAISDVRDAVSRARNTLPDDVDEPIVTRDNGEDEVLLWLNLSSSTMDRIALSNYTDNFIIKNLSLVDGVSQVRTVGALEKVMYVRLVPARMTALGVTVNDVITAIGQENIELPSGEIRNQDMFFPVEIKRVYVDSDTFEQLPIRHHGLETIRLRDIAVVEIKAKNEESIYHRNGVSSIGIGVIPQSNANPLEVSLGIKAQVEKLRKFLPPGANLVLDFDSTVYIQNSIDEVYSTLLLTSVLVIVVLYFFIGSWRTTLIPSLTVPISIIASFTGAWALGFSINIITLLSLILAIGLVVDDAIVMVENIAHHLTKGEGVLAACWNGAREVGFAIVATTVVLIMIFLPLMFMQGPTGTMFIEFAVLLSFAVFCSSVVALTLSPALCGYLLRKQEHLSWCSQLCFAIIAWIERLYSRLLTNLLHHIVVYPALLVAIIGIMVLFYQAIPHQFVPHEDRGVVYVYARGEEGSSIYRMKRNMQIIEDRLLPYLGKGVIKSISFSTPSLGQGSDQSGFVVLQLEDWTKRTQTSAQLVTELKAVLGDIPDLRVYVYEPGFQGRSGSPVKYIIRGSTYESLNAITLALSKDATNAGVIINADTNYSERTPQIEVSLNLDKAAVVGGSLKDISNALQTVLGGSSHTTYVDRGEEYDVYLRADEEEFKDLNQISQLNIKASNGEMVSLGSVAEFRIKARARRLPHFDRQKAITISAHPAPGKSLGEVLDWLDAWCAQHLENDMSTALTGESKDFRESENDIVLVLLLSIFVTYLVLAAQFESFMHPVTVMVTIPLGIFGGLMGLWIMHVSLNIYSQIGFMMLIGMVTKNGILIVEFANQLRVQGQTVHDAIIHASIRRLRPIMMTSLTSVIGALPLILATGSGFESRQAIGAVIFYGMAVSTIITLLILPGIYYVFASCTKVAGERERRLQQELDALK